MVSWKLSALLPIALGALGYAATDEKVEIPDQSPDIKVTASVSFPQAEIFGVKLINGVATEARISVHNEEPEAVTIIVVGGSLLEDAGDESRVLRNLTAQRYGLEVPAGERQTVAYSFSTEMHPQNLRLQLVGLLQDAKNNAYTLNLFNETVSVVESPTSIFDPQIIFLYLILLGVFGGTVYFIYNTWITTLFPQKKRSGGKDALRTRKSTGGVKKIDGSEQVPVVGADGPAVTSKSTAYDESWIPAQHLQRPEAKRVKSGTPKNKIVKG